MKTKKRIDYRPIDIESMSNREVRKAYSELRKIAVLRQKRIKAAFPHSRLAGTGKFWRFPQTRKLSNQKAAEALAEVSRFLREPLTTVKAQREMIEDLQSNFASRFNIELSKEEIPVFFDFMDELRARYDAKMVDSKRVAELYQEMQRSNISRENVIKNYSYYMGNLDRIKSLNLSKRSSRPWTAKEIRDRFNVNIEAELSRTKPARRGKR